MKRLSTRISRFIATRAVNEYSSGVVKLLDKSQLERLSARSHARPTFPLSVKVSSTVRKLHVAVNMCA